MGFTPLELVTRAGGTWQRENYTRPDGATETLYWKFLLKYTESFSQDANTSTAWIDCVFNQAGSLKLLFFGSAKYVTGGVLNRKLPYANPYYPKSHFIDRMDFEAFQGESPSGTCIATGPSGLPAVQGFAQYRLTFRGGLPYKLLTDNESATSAATINGAAAPVTTAEMLRFVSVSRRYIPEARKTPSAGFECYYEETLDPFPKKSFAPFVIQEVGTVPTFQTEIVAELVHWPYKNLPLGSIARMFGTVNSGSIKLDGETYPKGTLLFKGIAEPLTPYTWVDDERYCNCGLLFGYRPQTWSAHRLSDGRWMPIRVKGTTGTPQFASDDHLKLFTPEPPPG